MPSLYKITAATDAEQEMTLFASPGGPPKENSNIQTYAAHFYHRHADEPDGSHINIRH